MTAEESHHDYIIIDDPVTTPSSKEELQQFDRIWEKWLEAFNYGNFPGPEVSVQNHNRGK